MIYAQAIRLVLRSFFSYLKLEVVRPKIVDAIVLGSWLTGFREFTYHDVLGYVLLLNFSLKTSLYIANATTLALGCLLADLAGVYLKERSK